MNIRALFALPAAAVLALALTGCSGSEPEAAPTASATTVEPTAFDSDAYATLLSTGPIASESTVKSSAWAQAVREAGVLRVAGSGFSGSGARDEAAAQGDFDAGLAELLARYVLGENARVEWVAPSADGCEASLADGAADIAIAACEWTAVRTVGAEYAGPYYAPEEGVQYGMALVRRSDGRGFVNDFLRTVEYDGAYNELWTLALKPVVGGEMPDTPRIVR